MSEPRPELGPLGGTATQRLARFAAQLDLERVPPEVRAAACLHFLDLIGCGLLAAGVEAAPYADDLERDAAAGAATAIGFGEPVQPETAALVNGIRCHALDFDDTHPGSIAHVSAAVAPAALAAVEAVGGDGSRLLRALIAGNEVTCRIGRPAGDAFHRRGFHPTAICGVFGATTAIAVAREAGEATLVNALGIAGSMAAGLMAYLSDGAATKPIHPGWMAHAAHFAVRLAAAGATGPAAVLEGQNGVYPAFVELDRVDPAELTDDLGRNWETPRIAFKPYAACHFIHAPLDALLELRSEHGFGPAEVERITFVSPRAGIDLVAAPLERKRRPQTSYEAKFSAPFALGAALATGRTDPQVFAAEQLGSVEIQALADRVDYEEREYETFPTSLPGGVRVLLRDGTQWERHLDHQRGGAANPLAAEDVIEKFRFNAATALPQVALAALEEAILGLASLPTLEPFGLLRSAGPGAR